LPIVVPYSGWLIPEVGAYCRHPTRITFPAATIAPGNKITLQAVQLGAGSGNRNRLMRVALSFFTLMYLQSRKFQGLWARTLLRTHWQKECPNRDCSRWQSTTRLRGCDDKELRDVFARCSPSGIRHARSEFRCRRIRLGLATARDDPAGKQELYSPRSLIGLLGPVNVGSDDSHMPG
jgi:hypothetical protein